MLKKFVILTCLLNSLAINAIKVNKPYTLYLNVECSEKEDPNSQERPFNHHRLPSRRICCVIDEFEVSLTSSDYQIISYELYDGDGICLDISSSQEDFIQSFFSQAGLVEVRFLTSEGITFAGYTEL